MAQDIPGLDLRILPRHWEKIGQVLVLRVPDSLLPWREAIAQIYARVLRATTVVQDHARIRGPWRVPEIERIWGGGTETVHVENGIRFKLDVAKVMFSSGNLRERIRMAGVGRPGETVVDLFAGIGYFSLPLAVHGHPARVVSCEVNPAAFHFLQENTRLNRAGVVEPRFGDCRDVAPAGVADRVILGHFDADKFLDVAFRAAKDRVTIDLHTLIHEGRAESDSIENRLTREGARHRFGLVRSSTHHVKDYGPHVRHIVTDAEFVRK